MLTQPHGHLRIGVRLVLEVSQWSRDFEVGHLPLIPTGCARYDSIHAPSVRLAWCRYAGLIGRLLRRRWRRAPGGPCGRRPRRARRSSRIREPFGLTPRLSEFSAPLNPLSRSRGEMRPRPYATAGSDRDGDASRRELDGSVAKPKGRGEAVISPALGFAGSSRHWHESSS